MDFHSLTRKELQTLCKQNKIPANITNVAMADALASLDQVEGLEEFMKESKSESHQLPVEAVKGSPAVPRTACRTSTRRKPVGKELESSKIVTRTRQRQAVAEEVDQQRTEVVPKTPAAPSSRRAPPVSAQQKTEPQKEESSVQRACSTRRSVRLLEKTMEKLTLVEDRNIQPLKMDELSNEEMANGSKLATSGTNMQTSSEVCLEKTEDLEVSSALKSEGSPEIQMANNNDVQGKREDHVTELEDSMEKSALMVSVERSGENVDVVDENYGGKEIDSIQDETQNSQNEESKAEQDLGTEGSLPAEISVDVSSDVVTQDIAPKSPLSLEENEFSAVKESVEHIPSVEAENFEKLSSEASAMTENLNMKSPRSDLRVIEDDYQRNFDFESKSVTEENSDDSNEEESAESEALDGNSSKHPEQISNDNVESEEKETYLVDNVVEAKTAVAEDSCQGKCDFESESVTEEESGDDISEVESQENEASDDESVESDPSDEGFTDNENVSDESDETDLEASLVDVHVTEGEVSVITQSQFNPCPVDDVNIQDATGYGALVDVYVVSAAEFTTMTSEHLPSKSPPSLKETSPAHHLVSGSNVTTTKSPFPAFSADQLSGQFPRPSLPTPSKSASKSHPIIRRITDVLDEHEENMAVPPAGGNEVKKNENPGDSISMAKLYEGTSLRQLQKMLKEKMQIKNEKKMLQVGKTRVALQTLPDNRLAADGPQKEN